METDETTPLRVSEPDRSYVYMSARNRVYRSKVRQFQCCICAGLLGIFVLAVIITVSYLVNHDIDDLPAELEVNNETNVVQLQQLQRMLQSTGVFKDTENVRIPVSGYNSKELEAAFVEAKVDIKIKEDDEKMHPPVPLPPTHPSSLHQKVLYSSPTALRASKSGQLLLAMTKKIYKDKWTSPDWTGRGPPLQPSVYVSEEWCPTQQEASASCNYSSPYRTIDGTCNNKENPDYGTTMKPFRRLMPTAYADGISSPRKATDGSDLPSAREVSISVHRPVYKNDPKFTVVLAVWGQFVDHDFTATALSQRADGTAITCCNTVWQHPECFPVPLDAGDPFYHQYNITCMDFVRSAPAPTCSLGPREQFNQVTPFIDGSVIYGATPELEAELRTFTNGLLVSSRSADGRELLPVDRKPTDGCNQAEEAAKGRYCFKSGDARANENLHLTTLHLIFARQHNKLATQLKALNPSWTDEKLYQESRKIVGAQLQHVHYNEFLPIVLGRDFADEIGITPKPNGYYHGYNASVNPQIANEFASTAFRFGHTLLQGLLKMIAGDRSSEDYVQLHKMLFNPFGLYETGYIEKAVRGATQTPLNKPGNSFTPELQGNLFKPKTGPCGLDLVSINIQRGRDHGLPGYPSWREHCGGSKPANFEDLEEIMDSETVARLRTLYKTVDDIDPYTGLVSETPVTTSGILGPTATCIISEQFIRMKMGDRFWYETPEAPQAFTPDQLAEIKKTTLSSILCDNTDALEEVQPYAMEAITAENKITPCSEIPRPDLDAWIEIPTVHLVQAAGIKPRPFTAEQVDSNLRDPTDPIGRIAAKGELVVGATVVSGVVTGSFDGEPSASLWDGTFPVTIPTNFINQILLPDGEPMTPLDPALIDHKGGVIWTGSVDLVGTKRLELNADFSVPIYVYGAAYTQKWWNGHAKVQLNVNWNTTDLEEQTTGDFFTPIALRSKFNDTEVGVGAVPILSSPEVATLRFPILLKGNFNWDHSEFYWNGNVTIVYPKKPNALLKSSYYGGSSYYGRGSGGSSYYGRGSGGSSYYGRGSNYEGTPFVRPPPRLAVGATAKQGSISGSYDGGITQTLWDGTFPVAIPHPFLDRKLPPGTVVPTPDPTKPIEHRGGAFWNGKLEINADNDFVMTGTFSLPVFLHAGMGVTVQKWWSGSFDITLSVNWNSTVIHDLPDGKYFSPLAFRPAKKYGPSHPYTFLRTVNPTALDNTAPAPLPSFPLVLQGENSIDGSQFLWNGNVTLVFPKDPPPTAPTTTLLKATKPTKISKKPKKPVDPIAAAIKPIIFGGNVTFANYTFDEPSSWDGSEPLNISLPSKGIGPLAALDVFHGGSSMFVGSISTSSLTEVIVSGNFSVPIANSSDPTTLIWKSGTIDAVLNVTWNSSLPAALSSPNVTLYCTIYLKNTTTTPKSKKPTPLMNNLMAVAKKGPATMPSCVLILSGSSSDNTSFAWSGSYTAIITAPPTIAPPLIPSRTKREVKDEKPLLALSHGSRAHLPGQPMTYGHKMVLGGRVVKGRITAHSGSSPERTLYHGSLPVTIPMPAFDRYLPKTTAEYIHTNTGPIFHGNGPLWSGSVNYRPGTRYIELYGDFRVPLYLHGDTFTQEWWLGHAEMVVEVAWNSTALDYAPIASLPEADFYSPIRFRADEDPTSDPDAYAKSQQSDPDMMNTIPMTSPNEPFYPKGPMPKFPIILHGSMNEDRSAFLWFGNLTMVFPYVQ